MLNARLSMAMNTWRDGTNSKRTVALRVLNIQRESARRSMLEAWAKLRHRNLIQQFHVMTNELYVRPAYSTWMKLWYIRRMACPLVLLGVKFAYNVWVEVWTRMVVKRTRDFMYGRERIRACYRGRGLIRTLRHTGLRGILGVWRHHLLSGSPRLSMAWVKWKAAATRVQVALAFRKRVVKKLKQRGMVAFEIASDHRRLEDRLESLSAGRRAKLKMWKTEIMSAERHANLLKRALEKAHAKSSEELRAVELERDQAINEAKAAVLMADCERRAALKALHAQTPTHSPPKPRVRVDRWSTAAARGHAHHSVAPEQLEKIFTIQRQTSAEYAEKAKMVTPHVRTASKVVGAVSLFSSAGRRHHARDEIAAAEHAGGAGGAGDGLSPPSAEEPATPRTDAPRRMVPASRSEAALALAPSSARAPRGPSPSGSAPSARGVSPRSARGPTPMVAVGQIPTRMAPSTARQPSTVPAQRQAPKTGWALPSPRRLAEATPAPPPAAMKRSASASAAHFLAREPSSSSSHLD